MTLHALEFFSGIGGLHRALQTSTVPASVIRAFDWDQTACQVYDDNYGAKIVHKVDISTLTASSLLPLDASIWLLSPSCQPYTVLNPFAKGSADPRAKSFLNLIIHVLPDLVVQRRAPKWILVENVAGFETSSTRHILLHTLEQNDYNTIELLLNPLQYGIPNSRLRYYLLAKARPMTFAHVPCIENSGSCTTPGRAVWRHIPGDGSPWSDIRSDDHCSKDSNAEIRLYLDLNPDPDQDYPFRIPDRILEKWGRLFDIVVPSGRRTCCFTRGYGQMIERSGSVLQMNEELDTTETFDKFLAAQSKLKCGAVVDDVPQTTLPVTILHPLRLRYFSPSELLRLFHFIPPEYNEDVAFRPYPGSCQRFPEHGFNWPSSVSTKSKYRLIGNSVNVEVVRRLIEYLFEGDEMYINFTKEGGV